MNASLPMIYASIPRIACKGKCQAACGPIDASAREQEYFEAKTGRTFPDSLSLLRGALNGKPLTCPMLNAIGQCDVYQNRPSICRLWGVVPSMPCPFGCKPDRMLTESESRTILRDAE